MKRRILRFTTFVLICVFVGITFTDLRKEWESVPDFDIATTNGAPLQGTGIVLHDSTAVIYADRISQDPAALNSFAIEGVRAVSKSGAPASAAQMWELRTASATYVPGKMLFAEPVFIETEQGKAELTSLTHVEADLYNNRLIGDVELLVTTARGIFTHIGRIDLPLSGITNNDAEHFAQSDFPQSSGELKGETRIVLDGSEGDTIITTSGTVEANPNRIEIKEGFRLQYTTFTITGDRLIVYTDAEQQPTSADLFGNPVLVHSDIGTITSTVFELDLRRERISVPRRQAQSVQFRTGDIVMTAKNGGLLLDRANNLLTITDTTEVDASDQGRLSVGRMKAEFDPNSNAILRVRAFSQVNYQNAGLEVDAQESILDLVRDEIVLCGDIVAQTEYGQLSSECLKVDLKSLEYTLFAERASVLIQ